MKRRVIYQVLTDRFAGPQGRELRGLSRTGPAASWVQYAGGTYSGLLERLGYLEDLGVSALWLSPVPENSHLPAEPGKCRVDGYHGYWARDFERPNSSFGSLEDLKSLLSACRQKDIAPVLDVVLNHSNPTYSADRGNLYRDGVLFGCHRSNQAGVFHGQGDLDQSQAYDPYLWEHQDVWGLADLAQSNPLVSSHLKEVYSNWLSLGFQSVRLDTALHMPASWIREWVEAVQQNVPNCGHFFGEWWKGGPGDPISSKLARDSGLHLTDFELALALRAWMSNIGTLEELWHCVERQEDFQDPDLKVNFLDNHDMPRVLNLMLDTGLSLETATKRLQLGVVMLLMWRGIPCLYYGTETGLFTRRRARGKAMGDDPYNREPMRFCHENSEFKGIIQCLCRLRRETDLTDYPLTLKGRGTSTVHLNRGDLRLELSLTSSGQAGRTQLWWQDQQLWSLCLV